MTIADAREKCKKLARQAPRDVGIVLILILASSASFGLGLLSGKSSCSQQLDSPSASPTASTGKFVASKNGTRYYLPECAGAARISEENKMWFASAAAATAAGYAPASNCSGM